MGKKNRSKSRKEKKKHAKLAAKDDDNNDEQSNHKAVTPQEEPVGDEAAENQSGAAAEGQSSAAIETQKDATTEGQSIAAVESKNDAAAEDQSDAAVEIQSDAIAEGQTVAAAEGQTDAACQDGIPSKEVLEDAEMEGQCNSKDRIENYDEKRILHDEVVSEEIASKTISLQAQNEPQNVEEASSSNVEGLAEKDTTVQAEAPQPVTFQEDTQRPENEESAETSNELQPVPSKELSSNLTNVEIPIEKTLEEEVAQISEPSNTRSTTPSNLHENLDSAQQFNENLNSEGNKIHPVPEDHALNVEIGASTSQNESIGDTEKKSDSVAQDVASSSLNDKDVEKVACGGTEGIPEIANIVNGFSNEEKYDSESECTAKGAEETRDQFEKGLLQNDETVVDSKEVIKTEVRLDESEVLPNSKVSSTSAEVAALPIAEVEPKNGDSGKLSPLKLGLDDASVAKPSQKPEKDGEPKTKNSKNLVYKFIMKKSAKEDCASGKTGAKEHSQSSKSSGSKSKEGSPKFPQKHSTKCSDSESAKDAVSIAESNHMAEDTTSLCSQTPSIGDTSSFCSALISPKFDSDATSEYSRELSPDSALDSSRDLGESPSDSKLLGAFSKLKSKRWKKSKRESGGRTSPSMGLHFHIGQKIDSMFSSKKSKDKDGSIRSKGRDGNSTLDNIFHSDPTCSTLQSSVSWDSGQQPVVQMSDDEINVAFKELLKQMNIKGEKLDALLSNDMAKKRQMVFQSMKLNVTAQTATRHPLDFIHRMERVLHLREDGWGLLKDFMKDMKVQLSVEKVDWIAEFGRLGGIRHLLLIMRSLIDAFRGGDLGEREEDTALLLFDSVKCLKSVVNTWPGMDLCFKKDSKMFACLVGTLTVASRKPPLDCWEALKFETLSLLTVVAFINDDQFEVRGRDMLLRELTEEGRRRSCERFRCIVDCIRKSKRLDVVKKALMLVNIILDVRDPEDTSSDEGKAEAEEAWQMRMHWRSEFMRAGLFDCTEFLEKCSLESIRAQYDTFCHNKEADFTELIGRFEQIKGEYEDVESCFALLLSSVKETKAENSLLSIFQHLLLIPDDFIIRANYFRLIENCVSEIVLPKTCVDPDFRGKFEFTQDVSQIVDASDDSDVIQQFNKRLEAATQAKNEALAKQSQYYRKMEEFAKEAKLLRKHIANPTAPIPEPTSCKLPPPAVLSESTTPLPSADAEALPPSSQPAGGSTIPPPPPLPPGLLPTGGPSIPPPPPPPPPFGGPMGGVPPPPPPPPMPGFPAPPGSGPLPPPSLLGAAPIPKSPELPEYLKKKTKRVVDVPLKKIAWNSATIKPLQIPKESFWAQTSEEQLANDKLFSMLKAKFATSRQTTGEVQKPVMPTRKVKKPLVIQDEKVLQSLAILQGSCKIPRAEWKRALLEVDEKVLDPNTVQQLRNALPAPDVMKKLKEIPEKSFPEMPEGEQFAATFATIDKLPSRLDCIIFRLRFSEILNDLKSCISAVIEACDEIRTSSGFKIFLEITLLVGNYMGHSAKTYKDAFGFEFSVLTKLVDTKDVDNTGTLLHALVRQMQEMNASQAQFPMKDFMHIVKASRVNAEDTAKGVESIKSSLTKLENVLREYKQQGPNDLFSEKMTPFMDMAKGECDIVDKMYNTMETKWNLMQKYFVFDSKRYSMESFFSDMRTFKEQYENAYRDIEKAKELKEQEEQKKRRQPFRPIQSSNVTSPMKGGGVKIDGLLKTGKEAAGVVDEIEKFLECGYLKGAERKTPRNTPRSRAGRAALQRQRSRCADVHMSLPMDEVPKLELPTSGTVRVRRKGQPTYTVDLSNKQAAKPKENAKPKRALETDDLLLRLDQL